ncbi:hypothetical protein VTJ04DRAFT_7464 [Mycothermus thermophilus]|uniref:uncharacterized protein n=1 Tax=Humicola insolens TaxID=85995 RepID=UPI0037441429
MLISNDLSATESSARRKRIMPALGTASTSEAASTINNGVNDFVAERVSEPQNTTTNNRDEHTVEAGPKGPSHGVGAKGEQTGGADQAGGDQDAGVRNQPGYYIHVGNAGANADNIGDDNPIELQFAHMMATYATNMGIMVDDYPIDLELAPLPASNAAIMDNTVDHDHQIEVEFELELSRLTPANVVVNNNNQSNLEVIQLGATYYPDNIDDDHQIQHYLGQPEVAPYVPFSPSPSPPRSISSISSNSSGNSTDDEPYEDGSERKTIAWVLNQSWGLGGPEDGSWNADRATRDRGQLFGTQGYSHGEGEI